VLVGKQKGRRASKCQGIRVAGPIVGLCGLCEPSHRARSESHRLKVGSSKANKKVEGGKGSGGAKGGSRPKSQPKAKGRAHVHVMIEAMFRLKVRQGRGGLGFGRGQGRRLGRGA